MLVFHTISYINFYIMDLVYLIIEKFKYYIITHNGKVIRVLD